MQKHEYMTFDWLRDNCAKIHYFGLGFVQLKLKDPRYRLHFYTAELPAIIGEEDIHNHRYDFCSTVLCGNFRQDLFRLVRGDTHIMKAESCRPDVKVEVDSAVCGILNVSSHAYAAGSRYFLHRDVFHRVSGEEAVTLLERGEVAKEYAEVVRPRGDEEVCPFSKIVPEDDLWGIVEDMHRVGDLREQIWSDLV